jgi:integrase
MNKNIPVENRAHGDEIRSENRRRVIEHECQMVDQYLDRHCEDILQGVCENPVSEQRIDSLFASVKEGAAGKAIKIRHNYLAECLHKIAREHELDLPNQQRMLVLHGESAPTTPAGFYDLSIGQDWLKEFWSDIEFPRKRNDVDEHKVDAGQLVFSFIVFGGIHSKKKLLSLIAAIPKGVRHFHGLTWMDIETNQGLWRWFPDPVSLLLLKRWYKIHGGDHWPSGVNTDVSRLAFNFLKFLKALPGDLASPNRVLRLLIESSSTRDATWIEGVFHHIQRSPGATVSLPADAWARLLDKKVPPLLSKKIETDESKPVSDLRPLSGSCDSDVYAGVRAIQRVLKQATRKSAAGERDKTYQLLNAIAGDECWAPVVRVLASWCANMRRYGGRQGRLVISSIQRYFSTIANPLATILSMTGDLNALGEDEWEWVYDQLLSSSPSGKRRSDRAIVAGWFHAFMVVQFGMPEVEIEGATANGEVDADILTPAEYVRAQNILAHSEVSRRLVTVRKIVLTLGYRCGLRRTEIQKILIKDVQGLMAPVLSRPELLTRGNQFAGQKSNSGTRRLPLWALLTETELSQLQDWYQHRLKEPNTKESDLLFCAPQRGNQLIPQRHLFVPIQEAMRAASGTGSLRFHHLRHSCVTLTGVRLLERWPGELMKESWATDDAENIVMPHWGRDIFAIANRSTEWAPTRKKLWFLALLAGHASPGQTLLSYAHLMDYVNGARQAERRLPVLTLRGQSSLLGSSTGSMEVYRNRHGLTGATTARELACTVQRGWPSGICITAATNLTAFKMPDHPTLSACLEPEPYTAFMIYDALFQFNRMVAEGHSRGEATQRVADRYDLAVITVEAWLNLGERLMQQRVRDGSHRSAQSQNPGKSAETVAYKDGIGGVAMPELPQCPAPPKSKLAHGHVEDVFERVRRWMREEPEPARSALQTVSDSAQRSKTQLSFTRDENKRAYLDLLKNAGLMHLVKIRVRAPENGLSDRDIKTHWSKQFQVPQARVAIASQKSKGDRFRYGSAQVEVRPEPTLGKGGSQNTMSALRFAVFALALVRAGEAAIEDAAKEEKQ